MLNVNCNWKIQKKISPGVAGRKKRQIPWRRSCCNLWLVNKSDLRLGVEPSSDRVLPLLQISGGLVDSCWNQPNEAIYLICHFVLQDSEKMKVCSHQSYKLTHMNGQNAENENPHCFVYNYFLNKTKKWKCLVIIAAPLIGQILMTLSGTSNKGTHHSRTIAVSR